MSKPDEDREQAHDEAPLRRAPEQSSAARGLKSYARYSGLAFQMIGTILLATFGGRYLDQRFDSSPTFTIVLLLIGLVLAVYLPLRTLLKQR